MPNLVQIVKEFTTFIGKRLEGIEAAVKSNKVEIPAFPEIPQYPDFPEHLSVELTNPPEIPTKIVVELAGVEKIIGNPGKQGDKGDKGDAPSEEELLSLIKPLIPAPLKGDKGDAPTKSELRDIIKPLIPTVKDGKTPTKEELRSLIKPLIPKPVPGKNGNDGSPDTGEQIIDKIRADKSDKKIPARKIEGIEEVTSELRTARANASFFMKFAGDTVRTYDLSDLLDGSTKTFTLPEACRVLLVISSSTPGILRPTVDYTTTSGTITFTSQIDETTTLSAGQSLVILYKTP